MNLSQAQNVVQALAPGEYYRTNYRGHESDYLPNLVSYFAGLLTTPGASLEVGPGWGTMVVYLAAAGWDVSLIDNVPVETYISPALLELTRAKYHHRDIFDRPLDGQFDVTICTQVLLHLKYRPDTAIRNISAMLKPGGTALYSVLRADKYPDMKTSHGVNGWRKLPAVGSLEDPPKDMVTYKLDSQGFTDLLRTAYDRVDLWLPEGTTVMFAKCAKSK